MKLFTLLSVALASFAFVLPAASEDASGGLERWTYVSHASNSTMMERSLPGLLTPSRLTGGGGLLEFDKRQQCTYSGYGPCPGRDFCCPTDGKCCQTRSCCYGYQNCCAGGGCCPTSSTCSTTQLYGQGCCPKGQSCNSYDGCRVGYAQCARDTDFCCPSGSTCQYNSNNKATACQSSTFATDSFTSFTASTSTAVAGLSLSSAGSSSASTSSSTTSTAPSPTPSNDSGDQDNDSQDLGSLGNVLGGGGGGANEATSMRAAATWFVGLVIAISTLVLGM